MAEYSHIDRRQFLATLTAAIVGPRSGWAAERAAGVRFPVIAFSKPFQNLDPEETAELIADIGYDGIECPVRKGGQILPERVEDDLPRMHDALMRRGRSLSLISTDIAAITP